jgi:SHS family lactate transporter-like MFS transporter
VLRRVVWACLLYGASFSIYYGLQGLWPTLLRTERGLAPAALTVPVTLFNVGMMAGAVGIGTLARRFGVVKVQAVPLVLLLCLLPLYVGAVPGWLWLGALGAGIFGAGISGVTPYLFTALFPAEVRARSFGIVYHVGAFIGAYTPFLVAWLARDGRMSLSAALSGTAAVATLLTLGLLVLRPRDVLPASVLGRGAEPEGG